MSLEFFAEFRKASESQLNAWPSTVRFGLVCSKSKYQFKECIQPSVVLILRNISDRICNLERAESSSNRKWVVFLHERISQYQSLIMLKHSTLPRFNSKSCWWYTAHKEL